MKCSGERSQALRWATAPGGSSRRDFRVGCSSSDEWWSSTRAVEVAAVFIVWLMCAECMK